MQYIIALAIMLLTAAPSFAAKTVFSDGNKATGTRGTVVTAQFLNDVNSHRHDGGAYDGAGILDAAADTGTANALVVNLTPALSAHVPRMPIYVQVGNANTGATTINVSGLGVKALKKKGNADLTAGDLAAGQLIAVAYDGTNYQLISAWSTSDASTLQGQSAAQLTPPGAIMAFAGTACPAGWATADGQPLLRSQFPALFAAIGVTWGGGDGVTTFLKPDLRGEFLRGADGGRGLDSGRIVGTYQTDMLKSHTHTISTSIPQASGGSGFTTLGIGGGVNTGATGGTETRPVNAAVLYCIKY